MINDDVLDFNYDHGLDLGPESCMCNFGMAYGCDVGHSGHTTIARRVLPGQPKAAWPLVHWDEQEQEGTTFAVSETRWLSGWLAAFPTWSRDELAEQREAVEAEAKGDETIGPVIDAILAGQRDTAALYAIAAPGSLLARTHALAKAQGIRLGRTVWASDAERQDYVAAWDALAAEDPLYNAPAAYALACRVSTPRAWAWLRRNLKYDVGGSVGVADLTRAAARHLLAHDRDAGSPYLPVLLAYESGEDMGGDPFHAAGRELLSRGAVLDAITAFENAILFERGWSEAFHADAYEGIHEAARVLGAPDFLAYLETMGAD